MLPPSHYGRCLKQVIIMVGVLNKLSLPKRARVSVLRHFVFAQHFFNCFERNRSTSGRPESLRGSTKPTHLSVSWSYSTLEMASSPTDIVHCEDQCGSSKRN